MNEMWNDEILKIRLSFDNGLTYVAYSETPQNNMIVKLNKHCKEQTNYTNMFGSITSKVIEVKLICTDELDINNTASPYYGYMHNGVKVELFISYDNVNWEPYGTYYVTSWGNKFFDGANELVNITAEDELQYILHNDIPKLSAYSGIKAGELIRKVLVGVGVDSNRIKISDELNNSLRFGVADDSKVGYFLNEICQALCAVIIISDNNDILIMPALKGYNNQYSLSEDYIEEIESSNNVNSIYTKVKITYEHTIGNLMGDIVSDVVELESGLNELNNIRFSRKAYCIAEVALESDNFDGSEEVNIKDFIAYQDGIDLDIDSKDKKEEVYVNVSGRYIKSVSKNVESFINYYGDTKAKENRNVTYEVYNKYVQTKEDAQRVADDLARYIEMMNHKISLKTLYTPRIALGDILTFENEFLKGKFKVISCDTYFGTVYSKNITVIPLRNHTVWDDSKSWEDSLQWAENKSIALN